MIDSFTVFLERKALYTLLGEDYYKIDATNGNSNLRTTIAQLGPTSTYTSLHPDTSKINPDDSLTVIIEKSILRLSAMKKDSNSYIIWNNNSIATVISKKCSKLTL